MIYRHLEYYRHLRTNICNMSYVVCRMVSNEVTVSKTQGPYACLSDCHACLSISSYAAKLRMARHVEAKSSDGSGILRPSVWNFANCTCENCPYLDLRIWPRSSTAAWCAGPRNETEPDDATTTTTTSTTTTTTHTNDNSDNDKQWQQYWYQSS